MSSSSYDARRLKRLKPACALVDTGRAYGTGFLIGEGRLLTCDHVMSDTDRAICRFGDERSKLFDFQVVARYPQVDSVVLEALEPAALAGVTTMEIGPADCSLEDWWGWGFPALVDGQGVPVWGQIADEHCVDPDGRHAIQLFATNLVGSNAQLGGLSGAPVLFGDRVIGMIYRTVAGSGDGNQARFGLIYAIPVGPAHPAFEGIVSLLPQTPAPLSPNATIAEWEQLRLFETLKKASSASSILRVLEEWNTKGNVPMPANVPHIAAERLLGMGAPGEALKVLGDIPVHSRAVQLSALAHSLRGEHDKARGLIATLVPSAESGGILGGMFKRRFFDTGNRAWLQGAFEEYERTHEVSPDPYPAINAASIALWLGELELSRTRASETRDLVEKKKETERTHWDWATLGEAALLLGDMESAVRYYRKAVALVPSHGRDIAVMRRQARRNLRELKVSGDRLEAVLTVGGVACFTGHRPDEPGRRPPRFPQDRLATVASRIRKALGDANIRFGFSSAASGADILFVEQLLLRGGEPTVFLPFPANDFIESSVGAEWQERFEALLLRTEVTVHVLNTAKPAHQALEDAAYARCNASIRAAAVDAGRLYDETPILIAVLRQRTEKEKAGGTAEAVQQWQERIIGPVVLIDPMDP